MNFYPLGVIAAVLLARPLTLAVQDSAEPKYEGRRLSQWVKDLSQGNYDVTFGRWSRQPRNAFRAFRNLGSAAVGVLTTSLTDKSFVVRYNAAEALQRIGPEAKDAVPMLLNALADPQRQVGLKAADALGSIGFEARSAIPQLAQLLHDTKEYPVAPHGFWRMSDHARDALVGIGPETLPVFLEELEHDNPTVRFQAAEALGGFADLVEQVVPALVQSLEDKEPVVRAMAAQSLGRLGSQAKAATPVLVRYLDDAGTYGIGGRDARSVSVNVAEALLTIGPDEKQIPALMKVLQPTTEPEANIRALQSSHWYVRWMAAEMLGGFGRKAKRAIPVLRSALENEEIRCAAAVAIARIDSVNDRARRIVIACVKSGEPQDRFHAVRTLRVMRWTDEATTAVLQQTLKDDVDYVRIAAAGALLRINPRSETALKAFRESFEATDGNLWNSLGYGGNWWDEVLFTLREVPSAAKLALPVVMKELQGEFNHSKAFEALSAIGPPAVTTVPGFAHQLHDERHVGRRRTAAFALGRLGQYSRAAVPSLVDALHDPRVVVRAASAEALGRTRVTKKPGCRGTHVGFEG